MRWIPSRFPDRAAWKRFRADVLPRLPSGLTAVKARAGVAVMAAGLAFANIAGAQEIATLPDVHAASSWPWIAAGAIVTLLIAVSFVSRRRIYAVVGR